MRTLEIPALIPLCLSGAMLLSAGCATIAEDYRVAEGSAHVRGYTSIAGDVEVGRRAKIGNARTVAGDIELREGGRAGSLTTVAGRIRLEADVMVEGSIRTISGDIQIGNGSTVAGDISTVAGHITVTGGVIKGSVTLDNGNLEITRTRVAGTVRVRHSDREGMETARLTIGPDSEVAAVVVEEEAVARLRIHRTARVGSIKGTEAEYYD